MSQQPPDDDWGSSSTPWQQPPQPGQPQPGQPQPGQPQQGQPWQQGPPPGQPQYGQPQYGQPQYGQPQYGQQPWGPTAPPQNIPNYLVPAILVTVLCFLPTGVAAIVFASQVNAKLRAGDVAGAKKASDNARLWSIISAVVGVVAVFLLVATSGA